MTRGLVSFPLLSCAQEQHILLSEKDFLTHLSSIPLGSSLLQSMTWGHWVPKIPLAAVPEHHSQQGWLMWLPAIPPEMCCCQAEHDFNLALLHLHQALPYPSEAFPVGNMLLPAVKGPCSQEEEPDIGPCFVCLWDAPAVEHVTILCPRGFPPEASPI